MDKPNKDSHSSDHPTIESNSIPTNNNCIISDCSFNYEVYLDLLESGKSQETSVYGATGTETLQEAIKKIESRLNQHPK